VKNYSFEIKQEGNEVLKENQEELKEDFNKSEPILVKLRRDEINKENFDQKKEKISNPDLSITSGRPKNEKRELSFLEKNNNTNKRRSLESWNHSDLKRFRGSFIFHKPNKGKL